MFTTVPLGFSFASVPCVTDNAPFPSVSKKNFVINVLVTWDYIEISLEIVLETLNIVNIVGVVSNPKDETRLIEAYNDSERSSSRIPRRNPVPAILLGEFEAARSNDGRINNAGNGRQRQS